MNVLKLFPTRVEFSCGNLHNIAFWIKIFLSNRDFGFYPLVHTCFSTITFCFTCQDAKRDLKKFGPKLWKKSGSNNTLEGNTSSHSRAYVLKVKKSFQKNIFTFLTFWSSRCRCLRWNVENKLIFSISGTFLFLEKSTWWYSCQNF